MFPPAFGALTRYSIHGDTLEMVSTEYRVPFRVVVISKSKMTVESNGGVRTEIYTCHIVNRPYVVIYASNTLQHP